MTAPELLAANSAYQTHATTAFIRLILEYITKNLLYGIDAKQSNLQETNIFLEIENISFMTFTAFTNTQSPLNTHICAAHLSRGPKINISYITITQ